MRLRSEPEDRHSANNTTIHPCPICEDWQVDFHGDTMQEFVEVRIAEDDHGVLQPSFNTKPWYDALDSVLEEHFRNAHPVEFTTFQLTGKISGCH